MSALAGPHPGALPALTVGAVVLAAGRSRRMPGANKLLEPLGGVSVVGHVVDAALAAGAAPVVVVTGHDARAVEKALEGRPVQLAHNARWALGMSGSLAVGLAALEGRVSGALICLGDMPGVSAGDMRSLIEAFRGGGEPDACVPVHAGQRGNPVLWAARWFGELSALEGDRGGRALLERLSGVLPVPVDGPGVLMDVDTREALERARRAADA